MRVLLILSLPLLLAACMSQPKATERYLSPAEQEVSVLLTSLMDTPDAKRTLVQRMGDEVLAEQEAYYQQHFDEAKGAYQIWEIQNFHRSLKGSGREIEGNRFTFFPQDSSKRFPIEEFRLYYDRDTAYLQFKHLTDFRLERRIGVDPENEENTVYVLQLFDRSHGLSDTEPALKKYWHPQWGTLAIEGIEGQRLLELQAKDEAVARLLEALKHPEN